MPILPKDSGNILRLALPTSSDNRIQKTQRIILPSQISESVKVVEATGTSHLPLPAHLAHLAQPRKVHEIRLKLLKTFSLQKVEPIGQEISALPKTLTKKIDLP